ncbi:MAG: NUDIX domain-containing protein [Eubacterium sp.]|nr:NUDIX domain-containing protein [Eubacterium sp.]
MRSKFCPHCGRKLELREIGDEGLTPWCADCERPIFDSFSTCVIVLAVNEDGEAVLIRQGYINTENYICVAGHIKPGENAEDTAVRELQEELGLETEKLYYVKSYPYGKKDLLMLGYVARVKKAPFVLSGEVDAAKWFSKEEMLAAMKAKTIAWQLAKEYKEHSENYPRPGV